MFMPKQPWLLLYKLTDYFCRAALVLASFRFDKATTRLSPGKGSRPMILTKLAKEMNWMLISH